MGAEDTAPSRRIDPARVKYRRLSRAYRLDSFDCNDDDLNEFLIEDAQRYQDVAVANTTLVLVDDQLAGYFALTSDSIRLRNRERPKVGPVREPLPIPEYPAVKIARFAVQKELQRRGLGSLMFNYILGLAQEIQDLEGCRFITVDAYPQSVDFYRGLGFVENQHHTLVREDSPTTSMRYDFWNAPQPDSETSLGEFTEDNG